MTTPLHICVRFRNKEVETLIPFPREWIGKHLDEIMPELSDILTKSEVFKDETSPANLDVLLWRKQGDVDMTIRETDEIFVPVHMQTPWMNKN